MHSVDEHEHHVVWNAFHEVHDFPVGGVLHPLVDVLHRDERSRACSIPGGHTITFELY